MPEGAIHKVVSEAMLMFPMYWNSHRAANMSVWWCCYHFLLVLESHVEFVADVWSLCWRIDMET